LIARPYTRRRTLSCSSIGPTVAIPVRTVEIEVFRAAEWEHIVFEEVSQIHVGAAPDPDGLQLTLTGEREGRPNQVETGILDVAQRHEPLLNSSIPRTDNGTSLPLAVRDDTLS
jgi:hypothetical protein